MSAVRTALDSSSGPILLEAGFQLATKVLYENKSVCNFHFTDDLPINL